MKKIYLSFAILTLFMASINGKENEKHLFILSGQSNMAGLDPKISFIPAVNKKFGKENVIVVKHAYGGRPIRQWYKIPKGAEKKDAILGPMYKKLMTMVKTAIKGKKVSTITFIWMQGERDAREKLGLVYKKSLMGLLDQLRKDLNHKNLKFVIGRINDFDMNNKSYLHWTMIRKILVEIASEHKDGVWVNTDDLNDTKKKKNDLHMTKSGYKILGERFAEKAIELITARVKK